MVEGKTIVSYMKPQHM